MKIIALVAAGLILTSAFPLHAQVAAAPAPEKAAPVKATCPCDNPNFKPLTEKARAVEAYWDARREYKIAKTIAGTAALFAIFGRNAGLLNEAQNSLSSAESKVFAARTKAEGLGALKVTGDDEQAVEIKLKKGVDYTL